MKEVIYENTHKDTPAFQSWT